MKTNSAEAIIKEIHLLGNAICFIALNDEPTWDTEDRIEDIANMLTVQLVSDTFEIPAIDVANRVLQFRKRMQRHNKLF